MRVEDMLDAISKIERYTAGMTYATFSTDEKTADAVIRNIGVIGEAARHIPAEVEARFPNLPWGKMRSIRNVVVHDYAGVDLQIVWETARNDLPPLVPQLREVLDAAT
jgi:uncharacterized protein with HEPN domain